jgi:hypothetical protein
MQHPLLFDKWDFAEETYSEAMIRYSGFGAKLFDMLDDRVPDILSSFRFFRSTRYQSEDIFAVYESIEEPFAIQLDPSCEVICIWSDTVNTIEIGDWSENEYEEAIKFIQEHFLTKAE